jgi:hypothetical protein
LLPLSRCGRGDLPEAGAAGDREFVHDALAQFAAIVEAFPVRGDITAD